MDANGYITHSIQVGDSLQKIAKHYGVQDWTALVHLNKLEYPFVFSLLQTSEYDDNPKVLKIGDKLLIPTENYDHNAPNLSIENAELYAYGRDLDLYSFNYDNETVKNSESKGELIDNNGDLLTADGIRNLRQRLLIRLSVPKGSLLMHPDFGSTLDRYIGLKNTPQVMIKIRLAVQECILSDKLITKISKMDLKFSAGMLTIDSVLIPVPPYAPFTFKGTIMQP